MKKVLLLSVLILFGCSKDSDSNDEQSAYQTLIEKLDGKMFSFTSGENFERAFWIDKTKQHPITSIDLKMTNNSISEVSCYENYYSDYYWKIFTDNNRQLKEFNVLVNDNEIYSSETVLTNNFAQEFCGAGEMIITMQIKLGTNGNVLILSDSFEYKYENSENVDCNQDEFIDNFNSVLYLVEDFPLTPSELCLLSN